MSVVTATRNQNTNRAGLIYNLSSLAAAAPVWFHPMPGGDSFLTLFAERITDATLSEKATPRGVMLYSDGSFATDPTWATISTATGSMDNLAAIPSEQPGIRTLTSAFSRGEYLFVLNKYQTSADAKVQALLQVFRIAQDKGITMLGEEIVPLGFQLGLYVDKRYLWIFGANGGYLCMIRKNWAKIGINPDASTGTGWQYWGKKRWNDEADYLDALMTTDGAIKAYGPCSMAHYRDTYYLLTSEANLSLPTNPTVAPTPSPLTDANTRKRMFPFLRSILGLIGGVLNGFVRLVAGVVKLLINLFCSLIEAVVGVFPQNVETQATPLVLSFLRAITGSISSTDQNYVDPAVQLENIIRALAGVPLGTDEPPTTTELSQGFLDSVIATSTGQPIANADSEPVGFMERIIRAITNHRPATSLVSDINADGVEDAITSWTNPAPVKSVANANVVIAAPGKTIAGVTVTAGDLVYLNGQNNATENGLYVYHGPTTSLTPTPDTFKVLTPLTPEVSWRAVAYSSRAVEDRWTKNNFTYSIAKTHRLYHGGVHLQEQIPLTPGFGVIESAAGVSLLDEFSNTTQVVTGTSPHTVVLPAIAKPVGSSVSTEGVVDIPVIPVTVLPILNIEDAQITEGNLGPRTVTFRVTLDKAVTNTVVLSYATFDATATGGNSDYQTTTGELTFAPGVISQEISVKVFGDNEYEIVNTTNEDGTLTPSGDETFTVEIYDPVNAEIGDGTAVCTIVNDDSRTLIESLLEDLKNIINGLIKGALKVGSILVNTVVTILKQTVSTMVAVVQETSQLIYSMVDAFLNKISNGRWDLPGETTPEENFADIIYIFGGGNGDTFQTLKDAAKEWFSVVRSSINVFTRGVVTIFQRMVQAVKTFLQIGNGSGIVGSAALMSAPTPDENGDYSINPEGTSAYSMVALETTATPENPVADPVAYIPYTIHNQTTTDIIVMASSRDKEIVVPNGSGYVFTPYNATPTLSSSWSWTYASQRAPRIRQGFPLVHTRALNVNTYHLSFEGEPGGGEFRLSHNGKLTAPITYVPGNAVGTQANIQLAMGDLTSITSYSVTPDTIQVPAPEQSDGTNTVDAPSDKDFTITITDDCGYLNVYSYRLINGAPTPEVVTVPGLEGGLSHNEIALTGPPDVKVRMYKKYELVHTGTPTGGELTLTYNGTELAPISYDLTHVPILDLMYQETGRTTRLARDIANALNALPKVEEVLVIPEVVPPAEPVDPDNPPLPVFTGNNTILIATADSVNTLVLTDYTLEDADVTQAELQSTVIPYLPPVLTLSDESDFTLLTAWSAMEPNPKEAAASGLAKAATEPTVAPEVDTIPELVGQLTAVVNQIAGGDIKVGLGVVDTTVGILTEAVYVITGKKVEASRATVNLVIEFLQELARQGEVTAKSAITFENILRQLTGGTGLMGKEDPTILGFVQNIFQLPGDVVVNLADHLRRIVKGILTK